ncbi:MAG: hypothetical protein WB390_09840, partial [Pseudolabrys sp.]
VVGKATLGGSAPFISARPPNAERSRRRQFQDHLAEFDESTSEDKYPNNCESQAEPDDRLRPRLIPNSMNDRLRGRKRDITHLLTPPREQKLTEKPPSYANFCGASRSLDRQWLNPHADTVAVCNPLGRQLGKFGIVRNNTKADKKIERHFECKII